jgi:hypothetical protein
MNLSEFAQDGSILTEINMSPSSLKQLASNINATVGIEFEMIVNNAVVTNSNDDGEWSPDYDEDIRTSSIGEILDFFNDGDHNSRQSIRNLERELRNDYQEWVDEQISDDWDGEKISYIQDWITENVSRSDIVDALGIDPEDDLGVTKNRMYELAERIADNYNNDWYQSAFEQYLEEKQEDDEYSDNRWLRQANLFYMSNIENRYEIMWPFWTSTGGDEESETNGDSVASDFSSAVGRDANYYNRYHGGDRSRQRANGYYIIEPDGSLNPQSSEDAGLEFISPPMKLSDMLEEMPRVVAWAKENGNYTSKGTGCGLHMNVSIDGVDQESRLDYVKLALLLGDDYVLKEFDRVGNSYCKSALNKIRSEAKALDANKMVEIMNNMRSGLNKLASQIIFQGRTDKFVSINNKSKYIEFRSPGGDWLNEDLSKLINTLLRFVVALDAATDENKYRDEYAKKLYKLLTPSEDKTNTIKYFSEFSAGKLPRSALVSFVRQARLERKATSGEPSQWLVKLRNGKIVVTASDKNQALEQARQQWDLVDSMSRSMYPDSLFVIEPYNQKDDVNPVSSAVPPSTQDLQQRRDAAAQSQVASGQVVDWKLVYIPADGDPQILHILRGIGPDQGAANRAAREWAANNRSELASIDASEIAVLPIRVPSGG